MNKLHRLDYILPGVLASMPVLDLIVGFSKGYPTQATPLSLLSLVVGLYLANTLRHLPARSDLNEMAHSPLYPSEELEEDLEQRSMIVANARLNRTLGAGLIFFGSALNLFWIMSIVAARLRFEPDSVRTDTGRLVEAGMVLLFTLMMLAVIFAGAKIYQTGRTEN
jgi:hypothetical protein